MNIPRHLIDKTAFYRLLDSNDAHHWLLTSLKKMTLNIYLQVISLKV